jgi:alanine racemase
VLQHSLKLKIYVNVAVKKPILVFAPYWKVFEQTYINNRITAVVGSFDELQDIHPSIEFHIEFDTGMGRLGFYPEQWPEIQEMIQSRGLKPTGIMTHFATAEDKKSDLTQKQIKLFQKLKNKIEKSFSGLIYHSSNSGGMIHYPEAAFDMVRSGLAMYGYSPDNSDIGLKPVLTWKSYITACKPIKKGMTVSYGARWTTPGDGYLLVIPIGYADGVSRSLSGKISVRIGDQMIQQVGTITMDYFMLFHTKPIITGTEVEILGANALDANDWAQISGTIPYEVLCAIHPKIRRVLV